MKPFLIVLSSLICCDAADKASTIELLYLIDPAKRTRVVWRVNAAELTKIPIWNGSGMPPLSVDKALAIARKSLKENNRSDARLFQVTLQRPVGTDGSDEVFFYYVKFETPASVEDFVITLDGMLVLPTTIPLQ